VRIDLAVFDLLGQKIVFVIVYDEDVNRSYGNE